MEKVSSFVLKIASRCDLNCSYCYMYNLGDKTYLKQPKFMTLETVKAFAGRLKSYSEKTDIEYIQIVFHGGEPLLLSPEYFRECVTIFKETIPEMNYNFTVQTNGVSLNQAWYDLFNANEIKIGISIDGPKKFHDKFRLFHNGKGSYDKVAKAVKLGKKNGLLGILMVVNTEIPPVDFYQEVKDLEVKNLNLLLPDGHYDKLPEGFDKENFGKNDYTPYADWLIELFLIWKKDKNRPIIRLFENFIEMLGGEDNIGNQLIGRKTNGVSVIETDGSIEVVDNLRACYEGITRNKINVNTHEIEDIFEEDIFDVYYNSHSKVCEQCLNCPVYDLCGGGFLGNRFSSKNGFNNPTIYCKDMVRLLSFIQNDIIDSFPAELLDKLDFETLSYDTILEDFKKPFLTKIDVAITEKLLSFKQNIVICT